MINSMEQIRWEGNDQKVNGLWMRQSFHSVRLAHPSAHLGGARSTAQGSRFFPKVRLSWVGVEQFSREVREQFGTWHSNWNFCERWKVHWSNLEIPLQISANKQQASILMIQTRTWWRFKCGWTHYKKVTFECLTIVWKVLESHVLISGSPKFSCLRPPQQLRGRPAPRVRRTFGSMEPWELSPGSIKELDVLDVVRSIQHCAKLLCCSHHFFWKTLICVN